MITRQNNISVYSLNKNVFRGGISIIYIGKNEKGGIYG